MPTEAEIRTLLKPIVERRSDVCYAKRFLICVPIRSVFAALFFERSGIKEDLNPKIVLYALCSLSDFGGTFAFPFTRPGTKTWGETLSYDSPWLRENANKIQPEPWLTSDSDYPDAVHAAIDAEMLPTVFALNDLVTGEAYNTGPGKPVGDRVAAAIPFRLAHGDFDWVMVNLGQSPSRNWYAPFCHWHCGDLTQRVFDHGNAITADEKRTIFARMHEREATAIRTMKLEKHWIPTPFPAEESGLE